MQTPVSDQRKPAPAWKSPWVIAWIGLVVVVLGVNITMVVLAISSNPGLVVEEYYEKGQDYERTVISRLANDPGWEMKADVPSEVKAGEPSMIRFFVVDKAGQPVTPDEVTLFGYRPSDASRDFSADMVVEDKGRFGVQVTFPLMGVWDMLITARTGEDEHSLSKRITVSRPDS